MMLKDVDLAIIIHPHALERMEERGATEDDVLTTLNTGRESQARYGRLRYSKTIYYGGFWRAEYYERKHIEVYCVREGADMIVLTVIVKYF